MGAAQICEKIGREFLEKERVLARHAAARATLWSVYAAGIISCLGWKRRLHPRIVEFDIGVGFYGKGDIPSDARLPVGRAA